MPRIMTDFGLDDAVKTHPNKMLLQKKKDPCTYKELREAYRIAMPIIKSGFRKKPVALYFDKSIYCISSMMAVVYAGIFILSLIQMPAERIE